MTPDELAKVAKGLTEAQRRVLDEVENAGPDGLGFGRSALFMRRKLLAMGMTERLPTNGFFQVAHEVLTPLGQAVAGWIRENEPHAD